MSEWNNQIKPMLKSLIKNGFFSVFLSNAAAKILSFFGGIVIVRILSKGDYGMYSYVMNSYSMLFILNDLGCNVAMMQYRSENHDNKALYNDYFTYPFKCAVLFSTIGAILLLFSPWLYPFSQEDAKLLTQSLCLLPYLTTITSFLLSNLRVEMQNRKFALLNLFQVIMHYGFIIPCSFFWKVRGALLANYGIAVATLLFAIWISRDYLKFNWKNTALSVKEKISFIRFAFASQLNNSIGALLNLFDIFLIGLVIANNEIVSSYKVASTIPQALMFIPNSILIYAGPMFARNRNNRLWVHKNYNKIIGGCFLINVIITVSGIAVAPLLVSIIYGNKYMDAVPCFRILMIDYFFTGTLRIPSANIIYTQHKVKINLMITIVSNIVNCILDILLIKRYGSIGAAVATLTVSIVASAIAFGYMRYWMRDENA